MDRIDFYQKCIIELIEKYGQLKVHGLGNLETEIIIDKERKHYILLVIGWNGYNRIYNCVTHIDIKMDKIWIQEDSTDLSIAEQLVEKGIPKDAIVLAYLHHEKRKLLEFAT